MTIEEADKRVREAKERVILCVLDAVPTGPECANLALASLEGPVKALREAESARRALDKPRLMTPRERAKQYYPVDVSKTLICALEADRADILTQAEKLPRWGWNHNKSRLEVVGLGELISLSDLRNLIEGK